MTLAAARSSSRLGGLDSLRGLAVLWMVAFHFSFDLNWFGYLHIDFGRDPVWIWQRLAIVSLFLFCAGSANRLAELRGRSRWRWWTRWLQIAGCALAVTLGSWLAFPDSFIYFGILQAVASMLLLQRWCCGRLGPWLLLLAPLALVAPTLAASPAFDAPLWNWTGLVAHKPVTEDYVPLLPWIALFWLGAGVASLRAGRIALRWLPAQPALAWLGRRPLTVYMLHQPLLIAGLWLLGHLLPGR